MRIELVRYNSFAFIFLFFQYGLCTFSNVFLDRKYLIIATTFVVGGLAIWLNRKKISKVFFKIVALVLFVLGIQYILFPNQGNAINFLASTFLTLGCSSLFIGSTKIDFIWLYHYGLKLSFVNLLLVEVYFILSYGQMEYLTMVFGYALLPSVLFFLYKAIYEHDRKYFILFLFLELQLLIWGARGCSLVVFFFILLKYLTENKKVRKLFLVLCSIIYLCIDYVVDFLLYLISILPVESYRLRNYKSMLSEGIWENSSGRNVIYENTFALFERNPWGLGVGFVGFDESQAALEYPHNLFLQVAIEYGIVGVCLVTILIISILKKIIKVDEFLYKGLMLVFFAMVFGRLLVSSSYWERPEFWGLVGYAFSSLKIKNIDVLNC